MLIPSLPGLMCMLVSSLSRRVNANSQLVLELSDLLVKLIKKGEC